MRSRVLRIMLVLFEALWLNVVVPGHKRGAVGLPGERCAACQPLAMAGCCEEAGGGGTGAGHPARHSHRDPAKHCAICYFAARVSPAPFVDLTLPPLKLTIWRAGEFRAFHTHHFHLTTYDGRGPPADA